jgi:hypothetical protein
MRTTKRYMHLAGVVFRDEANRLEERLLGGPVSTASSTDPASPTVTDGDAGSRSEAEDAAAA